MERFLQFAHVGYLLTSLMILAIVVALRMWYRKPTLYVYPLTHYVIKTKNLASSLCSYFFFWNRFLILFLMVLLIGKPQIVDSHSKIHIEGIDIMLVLDVSGSMESFDDLQDRQTRFSVAKKEALNFISKRPNDAIGLVIFGRYAFARCPLTADKNMLKAMVQELEIGQPSQDMSDGTVIIQGLVTAMRRLQHSQSKSKIIVLLTDGAPSEWDLKPADAIQIAHELGIKIYTIGVGDQGGYINDPVWGVRQYQTPVNKDLLRYIADNTGGQFFEAKKPKDLKKIYEKIDQLEKQSIETELYSKYHDYFMPIIWLIVILLMVELFLSTWIWFIV